jgi:ribonuclease-3
LIDLDGLQQNIGIYFKDTALLEQSFIHSSYLNENPSSTISDNERLEFLGDSILNFITSEKLYLEFPDLPEGELTKLRIALIREETLAQLATELNLGHYLYMGKGEESTGGRSRSSNLANAFEALIGAIFLDQGIDRVRDFILTNLDSHLNRMKTGETQPNYKSLLQEYTQAKHKKLPVYRLKKTSGPDHDKTFIVEVLIENKIAGLGSGKSKKSAEIDAARAACEKLAQINKQ